MSVHIFLSHFMRIVQFPLLTTSWPGGDTRLDDRWNLVFSLLWAGPGGCCLGQHQISDILYSHSSNSCGKDKYFDISILDIIGW